MTIIRTIHNRENPYVQLNKNALWDEKLSLKAAGLWARCMSRPDNWKFVIKELVNKCKEGRRAVDSAIQELIKYRYAMKVEHWEKDTEGKFTNGGVEYIFFEFPATDDEISHYQEEFKKSFRYCGFGNRRNGNCRNDDLLNKEYSSLDNLEDNKEKECKERSPKAPPTAEAVALAEHLFKKIKERLPTVKLPNMKKWAQDMDKLLRIDKRTPEQIKEVIDWLPNDEWLHANVLSPSALRAKFDTICSKMMLTKNKELIRKNRNFALEAKQKYPDKFKSLSFDDKYVMNRTASKELPFNLPEKTFRESFVSLFGGNLKGGSHG